MKERLEGILEGGHLGGYMDWMHWESIRHHRGCKFLGTTATHAKKKKEKMIDSSRKRIHMCMEDHLLP